MKNQTPKTQSAPVETAPIFPGVELETQVEEQVTTESKEEEGKEVKAPVAGKRVAEPEMELPFRGNKKPRKKSNQHANDMKRRNLKRAKLEPNLGESKRKQRHQPRIQTQQVLEVGVGSFEGFEMDNSVPETAVRQIPAPALVISVLFPANLFEAVTDDAWDNLCRGKFRSHGDLARSLKLKMLKVDNGPGNRNKGFRVNGAKKIEVWSLQQSLFETHVLMGIGLSDNKKFVQADYIAKPAAKALGIEGCELPAGGSLWWLYCNGQRGDLKLISSWCNLHHDKGGSIWGLCNLKFDVDNDIPEHYSVRELQLAVNSALLSKLQS